MQRSGPVVAVLLLVAAACSGGDVSPSRDTGTAAATVGVGTSTTSEDGTSSTTGGVGTSAVPTAVELTQTHEITGFGYTISHPAGWFADTRNTITAIAELKEDMEQALSSDTPQPRAGATIVLDHRPLSFMEEIGLPADNPTNEDLFELNIGFFAWTDIADRSQMTLFGVPALAIRATGRFDQPVVAIQAVRPDHGDIFFLSMRVPTQEALLEALPIWEAMVASIREADMTSTETVLAGTYDLGGFELFLTCVGDGSPTVLLEAPLGSSSGIWGGVLPAVGELTRACAYDRAGIGASDSAPEQAARTGERMVEDLVALLDASGINGPYVVVGHSFGGLLVRLFADENPEVIGVVLVESSHPDQEERFADLLGGASPDVPDSFNPEELDLQAVAAEAGTASSLGNIPLVVVTRGRPQALAPNASAELNAQAEEIWQALQADLLGLSTSSVQLIAEDSTHNVPMEQPDKITQGIQLLIEHLRSPDTPLETP